MSKLTNSLFQKAKTNRVFIIPNFNGLKIFIVNFIMLAIGLIYANNYLLLFNFLLFSLFIITMFYTHFNLHGLSLLSISQTPSFSGESSLIKLHFSSNDLLERFSIKARLYFKNDEYIGSSFNVDGNTGYATFNFTPNKRGIDRIKKIELYTTFPLDIFKAIIFFDIDSEFIIYPKRSLKRFSTSNSISTNENEQNNFNISNYIHGDKINRILWKKSTNGELKIKKEARSEKEAVVFEVDQFIKNDDLERTLEQIANGIHVCFESQIPFGLTLPNLKISANVPSEKHYQLTLKELSRYEP
jgi:uncharacterized protein (DUF58 family)